MNIREAKEQVKFTVKSYLTRNEVGEYVIPVERQRPVFLMGPPGIGKTAIMAQIASELGLALVSYSMTHHTRQSALGLPFIRDKVYGGQNVRVSEYTMSEIISSMYEEMERTGKKEGILFLDEINCVSETLAPSMLQFLQFKTFGMHRIPDGWIVVTAGNPPEYNNSVREFDIVTWDRLKRVDVEPDYDAWREYAINNGVHPAVLGYLDIKKTD
ncbi:MAG: AAA family ATPase, partial [Clostridia bacterium]|nr:AAA family ATPase [Clostridia bacterium]